MKKILAVGMCVLLSIGLLVGCSSKSDSSQSKVDAIKEKGEIVLGTTADYPPYEFHIMEDGKDKIVGMDIMIAQAIADEMGVELKILDMDFDGLIPALQGGKIDFILAGMNEDEERAKSVDFSNVYYSENQTIVIRKEDEALYKTLEDFSAKAMGAQKGTVQETFIDENLADSEKLGLGKIPDLIIALQSKKIEGVVLAVPVAKNYVAVNEDLMIAPVEFNVSTGVSVAMPKDSPEFVELVNSVLDKLNENDQVSKWFAEFNEIANK